MNTLLKKNVLKSACIVLAMVACTPSAELTLSGLSKKKFQTSVNGASTDLYVLRNQKGMEVCLTNLGARIVSILVPDKDGVQKDVVLGFDNISDYINIPSDFGAAIGRYANRIGNGQITIDGKTIQLPQNNGNHTLHGGPKGWQYSVFTAKLLSDTKIEMSVVSPDGDENFPGTVTAKVTYTLTEENAIEIQYQATTDAKTVINMTNHSYFNLSGDPSTPITDHILYLNANNFTPVDNTFIPTGEIRSVSGTPLDFTTPKAINIGINADDEQIKNGKGYDHNWILNTAGDASKLAAKVTSPKSGISLEVYTSEPGIQIYTGNFLNGTVAGKKNTVYQERTAICLETQHFPDSPHHPEWPTVLLEPGQTYKSTCVYKFTKYLK
ncbi:aldose 1-epimerase [Bacteroidia bacterium]|nr:aldose 1-epimerase [Bacteroidia bacterium]